MKSLTEISKERDTLATVSELTSAFEGIASMHIASIKDQVLNSQQFFAELWGIYTQIRVGKNFHFGRGANRNTINKELIILLTAEGSFSGDLDRRVVNDLKKVYTQDEQDVIVVGSHGASFLTQNKINYVKSFRAPSTDKYINVKPLIAEIQKYKSTTIFYPSYISLTNQQVKTIKVNVLVEELGENVEASEDTINESSYIFEPSAFAVVDHLEQTMLIIMLGEIILESKLAQYASRFRAMNAAKEKAISNYHEVAVSYNRTKRLIKDERAKEVFNGLRKARK